MLEWKDSYSSQISGGQQQRAAIARAVAMEPSILLLDEPTSALDPELTKEVQGAIRTIANDGITMLIVTHEIDFAKEISDRIVFMDKGNIVEQGTPSEIFNSPKEARTKEFLEALCPAGLSDSDLIHRMRRILIMKNRNKFVKITVLADSWRTGSSRTSGKCSGR